MKKLILLTAVLLTGCISVPVQRKFPDAPQALFEPCVDLSLHPSSKKLSDQLKVVTQNYGEYHICRAKVNSWVTWYNEQKKIFEQATK